MPDPAVTLKFPVPLRMVEVVLMLLPALKLKFPSVVNVRGPEENDMSAVVEQTKFPVVEVKLLWTPTVPTALRVSVLLPQLTGL